MFQIVRCRLDDAGNVIECRALQPSYELREDALAMAEFDAARLPGACDFDDARQCWWASDERGCEHRFFVVEAAATDAAA
jgi:hypothetical protein